MLLTIDIGTSSFKSALWDYSGSRLSFAAAPLSSGVKDGVRHEADPAQWLTAFNQCCAKLGNLKQVEAIVISGNGPTLVPILESTLQDSQSQLKASNSQPPTPDSRLPTPASQLPTPHSNAILWLDRRAVKYQSEVSNVMGGFVDASFFLPKILAIKNEESGLYDRVKFFLGCPEFLAYALTGEARNVFPCEGFDRWFWDDISLEKLNLDKSKFPAFIKPGDPFGTLEPRLAERFGFSKTVTVFSGGPDFFASIVGSGVTEPGQACDRTGSSEGINLCTENRINDSRLMSYAHPVKPWGNLSGIINTTGKAVDWGRGLLGLNSFDEFIALAEKSAPGSGSLVFLPYLAGERAPVWNPKARAVFSGVSLSTGRGEFANSILEGIGFAIRDVLSVMAETGAAAAQLRVTGGLAGCSVLNRIKADITGLEVLEGVHKEAELLGLAIIGACSLGKFSSVKEASSALCRIERRYEPNIKHKTLYDELFTEYLSQRRDN